MSQFDYIMRDEFVAAVNKKITVFRNIVISQIWHILYLEVLQ
jgi:hypothetical protein